MNSKVASVLLYISCPLTLNLYGEQVIDYWFSFPVGLRCILVLVNLSLLGIYNFRLRSLNAIGTWKFHVPYMNN